MAIETVFYTQVGTIILFIVSLFTAYRVLVNQKDATIQLLREKCKFLEEKLDHASAEAPDVLARSLSERVDTLNSEIHRLLEDKQANQDLIKQREGELDKILGVADEFSRQLSNARELMSEFFCPDCRAPMAERAYHSESVEYQGRELDVDHEYVSFECGLTMLDGKVSQKCKNT